MYSLKWLYPRRLRNQLIMMAILMVIIPTLSIGYIVETEGRSAVLSEKEKISGGCAVAERRTGRSLYALPTSAS